MRLNLLVTTLFCVLLCFVSCKSKKQKPPPSGDAVLTASEFVELFPALEVPYQFSDTIVLKKDRDSAAISFKNFSRFVPDSVLAKMFGKNVKPKIFPVGRIALPEGGIALLAKAVTPDKHGVYVIGFDKNEQYGFSLPALVVDNNRQTVQTTTIDRRFSVVKTVIVKNADGSFSDGKDVYKINGDGKGFLLIMTDKLGDKVTELINPIDTLMRKSKWAADYTNGKMNLVSIRDGRHNDRVTFFIHFEKNNGECTGELKGEAFFKSPNTAEYREEGDPCILRFIFSSGAVTLKEQEGCGSRRGLNCAFDGSFTKKKVTPQKKK